MRPKKSLGQNFLMHARIAERIADVSGITKNDTVLEIGPGTGMLTRALLARTKKVIAVEADGELVSGLEKTFATEIASNRLKLIPADIRGFDPASIKDSYVLVANIPYYITGEIIRMFLSAKHKPSSMTLLVQKEVAVRIAREKKESILSLSVKVFGTPIYQFTVPRGAFRPAPNVDSAVLSVMNINQRTFPSTKAEERFFSILRAGFAHKRKRLAKNLEDVANAEDVAKAFEAAELTEHIRAEEVSLASWQTLAKKLSTPI